MNSLVYPVNGGMEDWAYAASWELAEPGQPEAPVPLEYVEPFGELGEAFTSGSGANPGMPPSASAEEPRTMPLCPARPLTPALAVIHVVS